MEISQIKLDDIPQELIISFYKESITPVIPTVS